MMKGLRWRERAVRGSLMVLLALAGCDQDTGVGGDVEPAAGREVVVTVGDAAATVDLSGLEAVTVDGAERVALSTLVAAAAPSHAVEDVELDDLFAGDGFHAASKSNCADLLPLTGALLDRGWVDPTTGNVGWDDALGYPGCLYVKDLVEIAVSTP